MEIRRLSRSRPCSTASTGAAGTTCQTLSLDMPCDDIVAQRGRPRLWRRRLKFDGMNRSAHRLADPSRCEGWDCVTRRQSVREHQAALAPFRIERRQADLGRRGLRGAPRWPRQSEAADDDREDPERYRGFARPRHCHAQGSHRQRRRSRHRPATHRSNASASRMTSKFRSDHRPDIIRLLDRKFGYPADRPVISDDEIKRLIDNYVLHRQTVPRPVVRFRRRQALSRLHLGHEFLGLGRSGRSPMAAARRTAPASCARSSKAFAPRRRDSRSACGFRRSIPCRSSRTLRFRVPGALGPGACRKHHATAVSLCASAAIPAIRSKSDLSHRNQGAVRDHAQAGRPLRQSDGGESLLHSASDPPRAVSAVRRLSSARRPVRRRDAPAQSGARRSKQPHSRTVSA